MTFDWKQALGSVALSAMALSMIGTGGAAAQSKQDPVKPTPPAAEKIETGQMLDKGPRPPIKLRQKATPPPVDDGATPAPSVDIETGQMLDKGPRRPPTVERGIKDPGVKSCSGCGMTGREAAPPATGDGATPAPSVDIETGQMLDKGKPRPPSAEKGIKDQAIKNSPQPGDKRTKSKGPKVRDDPISTKSSLLPVVGGVAALAALVTAVSGGGSDNPTSP